MSEAIQFVETDSGALYDAMMRLLEAEVGEPLYPGDERRIYGEALVAVFVGLYNTVNDAARQKLLRYARGNVLDALGERVGAYRLEASPAQTVIRFSVGAPATQNIIIPQWTRVTPDGTLYFATDDTAVLQAGTYSVDVPASSMGGGTVFNGILEGSITTLVDMIPFIQSVRNITPTAGGDDGEPYTTVGDDRFRERIRLAPSSFSTAGPEAAYRYYTLTADARIVDAAIVSDKETLQATVGVYDGHAFFGGAQLIVETLVVYVAEGGTPATQGVDYEAVYEGELLTITVLEGGTLAGATALDLSIVQIMAGRVKILPLLAGGQLPDEALIQTILDTVNADTIRPLTDLVTVEAPKPVPFDIEIKYFTTMQNEAAVIQAVEGAEGAITRYIAWQTEALGRDINPDQLRRLILAPDWAENLVGAIRVDVAAPAFEVVTELEVAQWSGHLVVFHEAVTGMV